jgi:two-component system cell cycle response regulator
MPKKTDWNDENTTEIAVNLLPLSAEQKPSAIEMVQGPGAPRTYELYSDDMVLGRAVDADIPINSTDLSRRHIQLKRTGPNTHTVIDLGSRNGLYLNGVKIHSAVLHEGDAIQLGSVVFIFHEGRS